MKNKIYRIFTVYVPAVKKWMAIDNEEVIKDLLKGLEEHPDVKPCEVTYNDNLKSISIRYNSGGDNRNDLIITNYYDTVEDYQEGIDGMEVFKRVFEIN